jgi:hypothetical protein
MPGRQAIAISMVVTKTKCRSQVFGDVGVMLGVCCVMGDLPVARWDKHYIHVPHHLDETMWSGEERGKRMG